MGNQRTFASMPWQAKGKVTRRERFLAEMDAVIPWARLLALIEPRYPKPGNSRQPLGLEKMLRIISCSTASICRTRRRRMRSTAASRCGVDPVCAGGGGRGPGAGRDHRPALRYPLEQHQLTEGIFDAVRNLLEQRRLWVRAGTIVDATIIAAPSSTKNAAAACDLEMKQTRKGNAWHFGMMLQVGTDPRGIVHTLRATDAAAADIPQFAQLLQGTRGFRRPGLLEGSQPPGRLPHAGSRYWINRRPTRKTLRSERWRMINRARSRTRASGEHAFRVVKQLWGFSKVRYRGLAKNQARTQTMLALANLYQVRRRLPAAQARPFSDRHHVSSIVKFPL